MSQVEEPTPEEVEAARTAVEQQADVVRALKSKKESKEAVALEVEKLKELKAELARMTALTADIWNRSDCEDLLKRRFFFTQSFEIYQGYGGLFDYGPPGTAAKNKLLEIWRNWFVLEESMLEIESVTVTPYEVLDASGHVERFKDNMVKDEETGECFRADHLLEDKMDELIAASKSAEERNELNIVRAQADCYSCEELDEKFEVYSILSPETGNALSKAFPFNLMFATSIGPRGDVQGFLRPETAQGIFVNFKRLLEFNQGKIPFAAAQIGKAFRNEISPRSGLLRVREFQMAEIEHFLHPEFKDHAKFDKVADIEVSLLPREFQMENKSLETFTIGDAVGQGIIDNQTLGYFIGRTSEFLKKVGIPSKRLRFRQHLKHEMAHYACDCWDAEIQCSYGWIECVGLADRSAYDLTHHADASGTDLFASRDLEEPLITNTLTCTPIKKMMGKAFKRDAQPLMKFLEALDEEAVQSLADQFEASEDNTAVITVNDKDFTLNQDMVTIETVENKQHVEKYIPSVVEPSFGIGRILYCLFENIFYTRKEDKQRGVLGFPICMSPIICSVLPLSNNPVFSDSIATVVDAIKAKGVSVKVDESSTAIGRRYARADELGIPLAVTIDFTTVEDNTVTLRERDTGAQIRGSIESIVDIIKQLVDESTQWNNVLESPPQDVTVLEREDLK